MKKLNPVWEPCECCDDYVCNLHDCHVADCPCPDIEAWVDKNVFPYADCLDEAGQIIDSLGSVVEIC